MLAALVQAFEKLFTEFSWRRLLHIVLVFVLAVGILVIFEWYTAYFQMSRLQKATDLLVRLSELRSDDRLKNNEDLQRISANLSAQLEEISRKRSLEFNAKASLPKFLAGGAIWFLLSFAFIPELRKRERDFVYAFILTIVLGFFFGFVGTLIPNLIWPWINYVLYPIGNFSLTFLIMKKVADSATPVLQP